MYCHEELTTYLKLGKERRRNVTAQLSRRSLSSANLIIISLSLQGINGNLPSTFRSNQENYTS